MTRSSIRWGILGCGAVCESKAGPALQAAPRSSLVAVMRRDGRKAEDFARRHGVPYWTDDARTLVERDDIDAVYVATPPSSHCELTELALAAGKQVLVEKPMAITAAECARMRAAEARSGRSLVVAYYKRCLPRFEAFRRLIAEGAVGVPQVVSVVQTRLAADQPGEAWKVDPALRGSGQFMDMQPHTLDWLALLFGGLRPGAAVRGTGQGETVTFSLGSDGPPVSGFCAYATDRDDDRLTVIGDAGRIDISMFRYAPVRLVTASGEQVFDIPDPAAVHRPIVERTIAHWLDGAPNPCTAEEGARTTALLETLGFVD